MEPAITEPLLEHDLSRHNMSYVVWYALRIRYEFYVRLNNSAAGICQINVRPSPLFLVPACELPSPTNYPTTSTRKTITLGFFAKFRCTEAKQHLDVSLKLLAKRSGTVQELNCDLGVHAEKQNVHSLHPTNVHLRKSKESLAWNA